MPWQTEVRTKRLSPTHNLSLRSAPWNSNRITSRFSWAKLLFVGPSEMNSLASFTNSTCLVCETEEPTSVRFRRRSRDLTFDRTTAYIDSRLSSIWSLGIVGIEGYNDGSMLLSLK